MTAHPFPFTVGQLAAIAAILTITGQHHPDHGDRNLAATIQHHLDHDHRQEDTDEPTE